MLAMISPAKEDNTAVMPGREKKRHMHAVALCIDLVVDVFAVDFEGLDMDIDDGVFSESGSEALLEFPAVVMGVVEGGVARHAQVHINGIYVSHLACTQMMQLLQFSIFAYNFSNLLLHLFGQAMLHEFAYCISK